jgi:glutathione S-transferase
MAVKLHRCSNLWVKVGGHPCWRVQKALDEAGIEYELVKEPSFSRGKRTETIARTGQSKLPWIELEDGTVVREESKDLAERIRSGKLLSG